MCVDVQIIDGPLDNTRASFRESGAGAVTAFEGVVRPNEAGDAIVALEYQTYDPMACIMLKQLAAEACKRFRLVAVHAMHSRGRVPVGHCSFRLIIASEHRGPGLEAMAWYIDRLKQDVPIWKQPIFASNKAEASA